MKDEATFKSIIKKSIRKDKGYVISLAAPMISGIPDLYMLYPDYIPVLLEAKFLKEVPAKFSRKINYSPMQVLFLEECNKVANNSAFGLIGFKWHGEYWAVLTDYISRQIDYTFASKFPHCLYNPKDKYFNVKNMLNMSAIPKLNKDLTTIVLPDSVAA